MPKGDGPRRRAAREEPVWFAHELSQRVEELMFTWEDLGQALEEGYLSMAESQARALSLRAMDLHRALVARPPSVRVAERDPLSA